MKLNIHIQALLYVKLSDILVEYKRIFFNSIVILKGRYNSVVWKLYL